MINSLYATADNISAEDIRTMANKYFVDNNRTTVTMSASESVAGFANEVRLDALVAEHQSKPTERHFTVLDNTNSSPLVDVNWLFYTGAAADPEGKKESGGTDCGNDCPKAAVSHKAVKIFKRLYIPWQGASAIKLTRK